MLLASWCVDGRPVSTWAAGAFTFGGLAAAAAAESPLLAGSRAAVEVVPVGGAVGVPISQAPRATLIGLSLVLRVSNADFWARAVGK